MRFQRFQRGASLLELVLIMTVAIGLMATLVRAFSHADEASDLADLKLMFEEVITAARASRPGGDYSTIASASVFSALGTYSPSSLTPTGELRGPDSVTFAIAATPIGVIPSAQQPAATGVVAYFDVVIASLSPERCEAFVRSIGTDQWARIQIRSTLYSSRLSSPHIQPTPQMLATPAYCRPSSGAPLVTVRVTSK